MKKHFLALVVTLVAYTFLHAEPLSVVKGAKTVQLDNGTTVIIKEDHSLPVVSVQVWVKVGSVNETPKTSGLSHFLEHLIFKGTAKYPGPEIARRVETQGGSINAATSKEFTQFYIDTQTSGYPEAIRILADAMANAVFPPEEIDRERPVVVEEIRRHADNPGALLYDYFCEAVFLKTPYKDSIVGSSDVIRNVSRDEIAAYYRAHYAPANLFVSITGDVKPDEALVLVRETFGAQKKGIAPAQPDLAEPLHGEKFIRKKKDIEQAYLLAGFIGPTMLSDDQFAADIASTILGGGRSSRLYRSLREEKRLVYSIGSSFWSQRGSGTLTLSAVFTPDKEKDVVEQSNAEIRRLISQGPTDAELARAKEMIKSQWYFGLESFHDQASIYGYWAMQGRPEIPDIYIPNIDKVQKADVVGFLKKYYEPQGLSSALLDPESK